MLHSRFNEAALRTPDGVRAFMEASKSQDDWNRRCDKVKAANGDDYPEFWAEAVLFSGVAANAQLKW